MRILIADNQVLQIGKQGEDNALQVRFPIADWITAYGHGTFQLMHKRSCDAEAQPVIVTSDEDYAYWTVRNSDVAYAGLGECELLYFVGGTLAKSHTWATLTIASIMPSGETPPEPWESWIEQVLAAGSQAKESADAAKVSEVNAESSAEEATTAAEEAKTNAENAERYAESAKEAANQISYVSFELDTNGDLMMNNSERLGGTNFSLNDDGDLEVEI